MHDASILHFYCE